MLTTILRNASIIDGSGNAPYSTDVAINDDRIALIGELRDRDAFEIVDCTGKVLCPGFIDVHAHSDALWLTLPTCDGKIAQGVTTEIGGNCGTSVAPRTDAAEEWQSLDQFFALVERRGVALNVATLVGLGTTRRAVADEDPAPLSAEQLDAQAALVRQACDQGALGVSSGLIYPPSRYAGKGELVAMAAAARQAGAPMYASHVRSEGNELVEAIEEALEVGKHAGVAVQCSHHKAAGRSNWGKVHRTLEMIAQARDAGIPASCDAYPYIASWTDLATVLPAETRFGGVDATLERLRDPQTATAVALALNLARDRDWHAIMVTDVHSERNANVAGMRIDEVAAAWGLSPANATIRLLIEERLDVGAIFFSMNEHDVAAVFSADFCCVGSDASVRALEGPTAQGVPHPRTFGTFPRVIKRYALQRRVFDLAQAVRRMTALPAHIFGLRGRGAIAEGAFADLVLFDPQTLCDTATYERPYAYPTGIERVFVNGRTVFKNGHPTGALPGRILRGGV